jgi:orotate phosphoribosyltransferase
MEEKTYKELVQEITTVNELFHLNKEEILEILYETKPIFFNGHFELLSGRHTDIFFRFALITQYPWLMEKISKEMIGWVTKSKPDIGQIDVVLGTSRAGMLFAYDIARELNGKMKTRAVYSKSDTNTGYPLPTLLEGFNIRKRERVLIVNDIITTGTGIRTLIDLTKSYGGEVVGICLFGDRALDAPKEKQIKEEYNFHSILTFKMNNWDAGKGKCYLCDKDVPCVHSKDINSLTLTQPIDNILEPLKTLRVA